jgi:hypothetical protein
MQNIFDCAGPCPRLLCARADCAIKCKIFEHEKERLKCGVGGARDFFVRETFMQNILYLSTRKKGLVDFAFEHEHHPRIPAQTFSRQPCSPVDSLTQGPPASSHQQNDTQERGRSVN